MPALSYLIFRLRGALYGVGARTVREVFPLPELTPVAGAPRCVPGVLNFRGKVIPVMEMAVRLGHGPRPFQLSDTVIVLQGEERLLGTVVDEVLEVREIADEETEAAPSFSARRPEGARPPGRVARAGSEIITLLDVGELLTFTEGMPLPEEAEHPEGWEASAAPLTAPAVAEADREIFRARARSLAQAPDGRETRDLVPIAVISLNDECFGVSLETVREFADIRQVTPVPCCPAHVVGAVNLRGEILTLVDVRRALQMPAAPDRRGAQMMVVQVGELRAGVVVDAVLDVVHLEGTETVPVPYSVKSPLEEHVSAAAPYKGKMLALLDLPGVFAREDWIVNAEP